jgi:26S proteasome regulatory subunit T6
MTIAVQAPTPVGGIKSYYQTKIEAAELLINQKTQNLRRLEAQRNALNARGESSVSPSVSRVLSSRFYRGI